MAMSKKAYFRIIEVVIAIMITFFIAMVIINKTSNVNIQEYQNIMFELSDNKDFRDCAAQKNSTCISHLVNETNPTFALRYNYIISFGDIPEVQAKDVMADTVILASEDIEQPIKIVMFYWKK